MPSAAFSAAIADSSRPVDSATAAVTRYGSGSVQAWPCGMLLELVSQVMAIPGSVISLIASSSMTMLAASCQSPASIACRTAVTSWPFRPYHWAARRCSRAIRSGCLLLSLRRNTSPSRMW